MHVYTKTGDAGETGLYTGERVKKASLRVDVYGTIDEADAAFGMARAFAKKEEVKSAIYDVQKKLSSLMADIASLDQKPLIHEEDVTALEQAMDAIEARLPKLTSFLIPGDTPAGACLDHARTIVRRAERRFCKLAEHEAVHGTDRRFLNRLSDYAFLLMRLEETDA
ncbi:MAG: cob(I)yrinic acid a,c-diamide adenosyltransferase [Selenomonadaceae bacterium]|nr:cob(I)yrinic acid a,c-diamide adenosyltransferase [Selenomonadaceae bacterium]